MPPSKSGIADYSGALFSQLEKLGAVSVFDGPDKAFNPADFDVALYHLGNNPHHDFVYDTAMRHPGVVVMHEANLHHLVAHLTIKRGDWDTYVAECEYNGGAAALAFAQRVRTLEVGPDYEGVAMTRRLLERSLGVIVHSDFVAREVRAQGFKGPIATIPHGVSVADTDRNGTRRLLGLDELTPLIGAFGYLKPYKRIAESLRALRRLVRLDPRVRMILVGEPHPEFPVHQLIGTLGLREHVRVLGFAPIEKFVDYMGACDIILNLRYPTVGETSGSLQRALGLGKAVIVSDIGAFAELPDDICLKVPAGPDLVAEEEDLIFEYLNTLVARPDLARAMGARAKEWVERECAWSKVAARYLEFLEQVNGSDLPAAAAEPPPEPFFIEDIQPEIIEAWVDPGSGDYAAIHKSRFVHTLEITPAGDPSKSILEMGAYMQITPALKFKLGYGVVRGCYFGAEGRVDTKSIVSESGETFACEIDHFDAEKHIYPYPDESFDTVLCCELIEHLFEDPMHMMSEINRILKRDGHLVLTTPNIGSLRSLSAGLLGYHPAFFPAYIRPRKQGENAEARHNREYVPMEIQHLLTGAGFETVRLETGEFLDEPHPELGWVTHLLERYALSHNLRGDGIYALGRKTGPVKDRWPSWLYA
ncbi:MAG: methyltransferase domain-containing protein, partial [Acidobacteriota bacterium]|nr:methyltransferase domain-containing protein [Acidobacteriota bacterium]